nr:hypothetical protein [Tanacetum cinerariifolium]
MAEENVPAPTRIDEQLVPVKAHLPIRTSNPQLSLHQLMFLLSMYSNSGTLLERMTRLALGITPKDSSHPFVSPPAGDLAIDFVNNLGYPEELQFVSKMHVNILYHPWRTILSMINQCLTCKTFEYYKKYLEMVVHKPRQPSTVTNEECGKKKKASKAVEDDEYNLQREVKGKGKGIVSDEQAAQSLLDLHKPKKQSIRDQYIFQRWTPVTRDASTRPSTQPQDDTSTNVVHDSSSPADSTNDAENVAAIDNLTVRWVLRFLMLNKYKVRKYHTVALEERTIKLDKGQAGSDPGKIPESRPPPKREFKEEDQARSNPRQIHLATDEQVHIKNPPSSSETLSSMKNLNDAFTFATTATATLLPQPPPLQSITDPDLATRIFALEKRSTDFEQKHQLRDKTTKALASRVYKLEHHDLYSNIDKQVNEVVKEAVHNALQASLHERFRDLSEFQMKEILHGRMLESGSYRSHPDHTTLYEAFKISMQRENNNEINEALTTSRKRHRDDQDPPPPPTKPVDDNPIPEDMHLSESEDTDATHLLKIKTRPNWLKPVLKEDTPEEPEPDWVIPLNDLHETKNNWADALVKTYTDPEEYKLGELVSSLWTESERDYDISSAYGISHWWFKRKEFYITRHSAPSDRNAVRSHMQILSVVILKIFSKYGYTYLKEIVLRITDYKEYKISKADFKNLHPNDFKDLYLLNIQVKLNHLSGADKVHLPTAVNFRNQRDLPKDNPMVSVEVLRLDLNNLSLKDPRTISCIDALILRTTSAAAKPCQGDSSEFYRITGSVKVKELQEKRIFKLPRSRKISYATGMEQGFLSQKEGGGGRGVKEKQQGSTNITTLVFGDSTNDTIKDTVMVSFDGDATPLVDSVEKEVVLPSVVDETVAKEKQSPLVNTTSFGSFPPLATQETLSAGNASGKSSYANVTGKQIGTKVNFCTLFTPEGNRIDVVVPVESIKAISERFVKLHGVPVTAFGKDGLSAIVTKLAMIELRADVELKHNIVATMPKIAGEGYYTCNIRVEYEWKPLRCTCCKVFGYVLKECPKNIGVGATKNLKKTSQTPKGILVRQKMGFKPTRQQVYQPVCKKLIANNGGNKKKNVKSTNEISKSNSFDALNNMFQPRLYMNITSLTYAILKREIGIGGEPGEGWLSGDILSQEANYSESSFWNAESSSPSTTSIIEKNNKMKNLIIDEKAILVDNEGKPLRKVDGDSEDEVASVDNEMASFLAKKDVYGQEIPDMLQAFCDDLDIKVRGRKKK